MLSIVAFLLTALIASSSSANATAFSFTQIDVPGAPGTVAFDINDAGEIVGYFGGVRPGLGVPVQAFVESGGSFTTINVPGADNTLARRINNIGQIVGFFNAGQGQSHGFLRNPDGSFIPIDVPGAIFGTGAEGINDTGQIVGTFSTGTNHGFLRQPDGSLTIIDAPGADNTSLQGINNAGEILGSFGTGGRPFVFLYLNGNFSIIDLLSELGANANDINDAEQIVGSVVGNHGFLYSNGILQIFDFPGAVNTEALGINNIGQIVGLFSDGTTLHGFLATPTAEPIPEPSTLTLLSVGIGFSVLCVMRRRVISSKPLKKCDPGLNAALNW